MSYAFDLTTRNWRRTITKKYDIKRALHCTAAHLWPDPDIFDYLIFMRVLFMLT